LKAIDALLSPRGKQIFDIGPSSKGWGTVAQPRSLEDLTQWFKRKGWPDVSLFNTDTSFGPGAGKVFACRPSNDLSETIVILPKAERSSADWTLHR
jgi:hypothetical protein